MTKVICRSDTAAQIRQALTAEQVAEFYGFTPDRGGFIRCPFHAGDNHGSLKLYPGARGWHCFGCNEGGTVIDFVMKLFNIPFREAVARLSADFGLNLTNSPPDRKARSEALERRRREAAARARRDEALRSLSEEYRRCYEIVNLCTPQQREDGTVWFHPLYEEAVKSLPVLEAKINEWEASCEQK